LDNSRGAFGFGDPLPLEGLLFDMCHATVMQDQLAIDFPKKEERSQRGSNPFRAKALTRDLGLL